MTSQELEKWRRELRQRGWFPANYPGACANCGTAFQPGVMITMALSSVCGWRAECCATRADL